MKGGVTKKLEDTIKSLDQKQLKKALYLSEAKGLEKHHQWIEEAARTCLTNKDNKKVCEQAIKEARDKVHDTVSLPIDDTSLEGLEDYMTEQKLPDETGPVEAPAVPSGFLAKAQKTDEELFQNCEECHVAVAASRFADICAEKPEEAGNCELIGRSLENEDTEPVDWLKAMFETAEKVTEGKIKDEMVAALTELTEYLEKRKSPILEALEKEVNHAEATAISAHTEEQDG